MTSSISRLNSLISTISIYNPFPFKKSKSLPPVQIHIGRYRTRRGVIDFFLLSWNMERAQGTVETPSFSDDSINPSSIKGASFGIEPAFAHFEDTQPPKAHRFFGGLKSPPSSPSSFSAPAQKKKVTKRRLGSIIQKLGSSWTPGVPNLPF